MPVTTASRATSIFFRGAKFYCHVNFFYYANFSIVFGPNFGGQKSLRGQSASGGGAPPCGRKSVRWNTNTRS